VLVTRHGGHCGYVAAASASSDGYWAEETAVDFLSRFMRA
jgi:predicted alpha/beta-fold hydrolase